MTTRLIRLIRVLPLLGYKNATRVAWHRLKVRAGAMRYLTPSGRRLRGQMFTGVRDTAGLSIPNGVVSAASELLDGRVTFFSCQSEQCTSPPNWFRWGEASSSHWATEAINDTTGRDVKKTWDLSRFHWAPVFAAAFRSTEDGKYLVALNTWIDNWNDLNPPNIGVNWVCAQEASIRVMSILNAAFLLGEVVCPGELLKQFVWEHCNRISHTIGYSIAQSNNHGISESAALLVCSNWLLLTAASKKERRILQQWAKVGRRVLESLCSHLIADDGGFSMYSLNYHRMVLDTLVQVAFWTQQLGLEPLTDSTLAAAGNMVDFLQWHIDEESGDVPNIGTNDGSYLSSQGFRPYRDFRPSVVNAAAAFGRPVASRLVSKDNTSCGWPNYRPCGQLKTREAFLGSRLFADSGFAVLRCRNAVAVMRFPRFQFRPSQADALHIDLSVQGRGLLRDAGSYSYNCSAEESNYFSGTASHNTVRFDGRDQMPRLGAFLFGEWLKTSKIEPLKADADCSRFGAGYSDSFGARHDRTVVLSNNCLLVHDDVSGFQKNAILRWRLGPGDWHLTNGEVSFDAVALKFESDAPITDIRLVDGWESLHYLEKSKIIVVELETEKPGRITTKVTW